MSMFNNETFPTHGALFLQRCLGNIMQYERICIKGASIDNQKCTKLGSCLNHCHFFLLL